MRLEDLPDDIREELLDPEFTSRSHYSRSTYALGCHGPLCRKAERDRGRHRNAFKAEVDGRKYRPNYDVRIEDDELLEKVIAWHKKQRRIA